MSTLTRTSASHSPPSLPSFAQTFSNISHPAPVVARATISIAADPHHPDDMHTLPPIHHNPPQNDIPDPPTHPDHTAAARKGKKRALQQDEGPAAQQKRPLEPNTPRAPSAVKQEPLSLSPSPGIAQIEHDELDASPPPRRPIKKRRVNPAPGSKSQQAVDTESSVSPDVAAFTAPNSDQGALEQVRATLSIKQKQKEIIEQRRGSTAGLSQSASGPPSQPGPSVRRQSGPGTNNAPPVPSSQQHPSPQQQQHPQPAKHPTPPHHFSPPHQSLPAPNNSFSSSRRHRGTLQINGHTLSSDPAHALTQPSRLPPPILTPSASTPTAHTFPQPLPPHPQTQGPPLTRTPAIAKSSTIRAAPPKPLTIAPHAHSRRLEPLVHSAPVIGGFGPVRVPELPPIPITPGSRRVSGAMAGPGPGVGGGGGASVAIAKSGGMRTAGLGLGRLSSSSAAGTVPPTPAYASLSSQQQQKAASQDGKGGFLQLFENFYDSLADSRLLKQWLQEQLAKSNTLLEQLGKLEKERESSGVTLSQVEEIIERRVGPMRNEVEGLKRRVGELEEMLYKERQRGGVGVGVPRRESYAPNTEFEEEKGPGRRASVRSSDGVFPERRDEPGERDWDREHRERERDHASPAGSLHSSPSFDQHRLSTSAVRLESGPAHAHVHPVFPLASSSQHRPSPLGLERERERERESSRTWEWRRHNADSTGSSSTNGRHDAPPSSSMQTQTRAPSA